MEKNNQKIFLIKDFQKTIKTRFVNLQCGRYSAPIPAEYSPTGKDMHYGEIWNFDKNTNKWIKSYEKTTNFNR